jgi:hypothetical protein
MARKARKPRTRKANAGTKDSKNGTRFQSDFVYEGKTAIDKVANYGTQLGEDPKLEFEYDKNGKYFVYTTTAGDEVKRTAYIGSFDITSDGIIKRATITEERSTGNSISNPWSTTGSYKYLYEQPVTLENVDGLVRFWAASASARKALSDKYGYNLPFQQTPGDSIDQLLFANEWWTTPFTSNIL